MEAVKTIEKAGLVLKLYHDTTAPNPRTEWDNIGTMICFSREHNLGDEHIFKSRVDVLRYIRDTGAVYLPVYHSYYRHYGEMTTDTAEMVRQKLKLAEIDLDADDADDQLADVWDERQVGVILVTSSDIVEEYGKDTAENRNLALECLKGEIETYNTFLAGEIYGYVIERPDACDSCSHVQAVTIDSCWGFYGMDDAEQEAMAALESAAKE